jgi:hypothetical protein
VEETESARTVSHGILLSSTCIRSSYSHEVLHGLPIIYAKNSIASMLNFAIHSFNIY